MIRVLQMAEDPAVETCIRSINQIKACSSQPRTSTGKPLRADIGKLLDRCAAARLGELDSPTAAITLEAQINDLVAVTTPSSST